MSDYNSKNLGATTPKQMSSYHEYTPHIILNYVYKKLFFLKIRSALLFKKSILVHFSGLSNGSSHYYPDDLSHVINNTNTPRCASSVTFPMILKEGKLWGEVGLILAPSNANSITAVKSSDAGSIIIDGEVITRHEDKNFSLETCLQAIGRQDSHDEWILNQFVVKGAFITRPYPYVRIQQKNEDIDGMDDVPDFLQSSSVTDSYHSISYLTVAKDLNLPVYEFKSESEFTQYTPSGQTNIVNYNDIYKFNAAERLFYTIYKHTLADNSVWSHAAASPKGRPAWRNILLLFIGLTMACLAVVIIFSMVISLRGYQ